MLTFLICWTILVACSYMLWFTRFDKVAEKYGGIAEAFRIGLEREDPEYKTLHPSGHVAIFKTAVLLICIISWPVVLYIILKSYWVDYLPSIVDREKKDD